MTQSRGKCFLPTKPGINFFPRKNANKRKGRSSPLVHSSLITIIGFFVGVAQPRLPTGRRYCRGFRTVPGKMAQEAAAAAQEVDFYLQDCLSVHCLVSSSNDIEVLY